jgi:RNA polymerase sigma factor (sigma-70 family)
MMSVDSFEIIVREHYEPLFKFAMNLTRVESDARDLTQQTFYVWATKGHQLRDISKVKTWLFTTLNRAFLTGRRRQIRFPHQSLEDVSQELPAACTELIDQADCSEVLPALAKVDEVFQAAVVLYYLEDHSYKDIAVELDVPIGTVKSRIARGVAQLREFFSADSNSPLRIANGHSVTRSGSFNKLATRVANAIQQPQSAKGSMIFDHS